MKTLGLLLGLFFTGLLVNAQESEGATVTITIENVLKDGGEIIASLHTADTFMKGPGIVNTQEEGKKGEVTLTFENVAPGTYAVMVMHDENSNQRMDFEDNGMPKESYGTTGDTMSMGPPTFEGAKFELGEEDLDIKIRF